VKESDKSSPKVSLGPISYYWSDKQIYDFYSDIAKTDVDIVYLGEVICSKRRSIDFEGWLEIAKFLQNNNKEVVLSTLTLIEAQSEIKTIKKICQNGFFKVEANDIATVQILSELNLPFSTGPSVNIYNVRSLRLLRKQGLYRWVMPVELSRDTLYDFQKKIDFNIEMEVFAFGKMPLAYSARCYTARFHNLPKDNCLYKCIDDADGKILKTKEKQNFLNINGIQTQSATCINLLDEIKNEKKAKIDIVRISPQSRATDKVIDIYCDNLKDDKKESPKIDKYILGEQTNGFWYGKPGIDL
jgi:O2-independent ubiquinone biosynthesis protein UbiV